MAISGKAGGDLGGKPYSIRFWGDCGGFQYDPDSGGGVLPDARLGSYDGCNTRPRAHCLAEDLGRMVAEANDVLGAFIRGQFVVMLAQAFLYSAGLWFVGLDFALILGTVAGLASIIPYAGAVLGVGSSLIVAWFQTGGDLSFIAWVGLVFAIGQTLESMFLTPVLIGDRIGLHPVMVIFALLAGGQLAGFTGVLLALPVAAVILVFCRHAVGYYRSTDTYRSD